MGLEDEATAIGNSFIAQARDRLEAAAKLVEHCARQLSEEQLWWRPQEAQNSVGNLLLHLTGNLRERILSVVGGHASMRDRAAEFAERGPIPSDKLLARFKSTVAECDATLAGLSPDQLTEERSYQGLSHRFEMDVLGVILHTLVHLAGHAQEIVFMTRIQRGEQYRFANPAGSAVQRGA